MLFRSKSNFTLTASAPPLSWHSSAVVENTLAYTFYTGGEEKIVAASDIPALQRATEGLVSVLSNSEH